MTKIFENDKLIWDSETRAEYTTGDAKTWLNFTLTERINKRENFVLPCVNFDRSPAEDAIETYKIKIELLEKLQEFYVSEEMELYIDFDPGNTFSKTTVYKIEESN